LKANIFITGFSGTGKTSVSREAARRLGWQFVDLDEEIIRAAGKSIESIFADEGEPGFRRIETERLAATSINERQVISTGGGIIMSERNRQIMEESGVIVCLEARPETIYHRLEKQNKGRGPVVRPMLTASDPLNRIRSLKDKRQFNYALAHWTVHTDHLAPGEAAKEVIRAWKLLSTRNNDNTSDDYDDLAAVVRTSAGDYPVWVGWGIIEELGERIRRILTPQTAYVITDEGVSRQARRLQLALEAADIPTHMFIMPPGEQHKNLDTAQHIYKWLAERKAERGHLVLAVGGGVVGDLAGYVAATYLRGMPFAQVPTSLLAMMDASIGGKAAVDLPQGKNLVGAFYQPRFVLADVETLRTLPKRDITSGWAEAIKHGLILDRGLLTIFERQSDLVKALKPEVATDVIRRSVAIKADIVSQDEKETLGVRVLLNYGHTIGHAIEASAGYGELLHGEAVSMGMMGSAYIGNAMGLMSDAEVERQRAILEKFDLPTSYSNLDVAAVTEAMQSDKKTSGKTIRWVLLDGIGNGVTRNDVSPEIVQQVLEKLAQNTPGSV
jgi:shikimate kinase/3-dehydroquinate synthase